LYPIFKESDTIVTNEDGYKSLQYDPLLEYMNWNSELNKYDPIYLVSGISLPNSPVSMSDTFTISPLTTAGKWPNTDLYRTIWITSGTNSFSKLFSFPNASTVIS
jgi:hypothetical protein